LLVETIDRSILPTARYSANHDTDSSKNMYHYISINYRHRALAELCDSHFRSTSSNPTGRLVNIWCFSWFEQNLQRPLLFIHSYTGYKEHGVQYRLSPGSKLTSLRTHPRPIKWVSGLKRPGREADHSPPSNVVVKNVWSNTSTLPKCLHGVAFN
jgi:hypothetical protein